MRLGTSKAVESCREWERVGILPDVCCESDEQLRALWKSPLFEIILANVLDFYPPASTNITNHIPTACNNIFGYALREFPLLSDTPYWQYVLFNSLPELYLDPFLPQNPGAKIIGCDLACGWGRACLSLRNYENRVIYGCDSSHKSLDLLSVLAKNSGLPDEIIPLHCDVTALPFIECLFDFYLAFDIFEHLTITSLGRLLCEILRCAKPGAILYTEIPLHSYCPAVSHIRDFSFEGIKELFEKTFAYGRRFELAQHYYSPLLLNHFTFRVSSNQSHEKL